MRSRSTPRQVSTEQELYASAVGALSRRAHSIHEMRKYLERRTEEKDITSQVIARLRERDYLNDARYALDFARHHATTRKQGRFRIARELRTRGVPDRHIEEALDVVFAETDEAASVRARLRRRMIHLRGPLDQRRLASLYGSLLRAGFSSDIIRAELHAITQTPVPEITEDFQEMI